MFSAAFIDNFNVVGGEFEMTSFLYLHDFLLHSHCCRDLRGEECHRVRGLLHGQADGQWGTVRVVVTTSPLNYE